MLYLFRLQLIASTLVIFATGYVSRVPIGCVTGWITGNSALYCTRSRDYAPMEANQVVADYFSNHNQPNEIEHGRKPALSGSSIGKNFRKIIASLALLPALFGGPVMPVNADDELARYAAEGNEVGVDGQCFMKKCPVETSKCASDLSCLKGLSCLARCKGGSMCSTGCFAKFGSSNLDDLLHCSVETNDCVHVPGKENTGWNVDKPSDLPSLPLVAFDPKSLEGTWYKVMGLDSRYDCFDCQKNSFKLKKNKNILEMEALFRIPRPNYPGYLQSKIEEQLQLQVADKKVESSSPSSSRDSKSKSSSKTDRSRDRDNTVLDAMMSSMLVSRDADDEINKSQQTEDNTNTKEVLQATMRSQGEMFGLTFWENWYILGDSKATTSSSSVPVISSIGIPGALATEAMKTPDLKLVFYTGHTLQGSYKGAFVYSRYPVLTAESMLAARNLISKARLNPDKFCIIRNQCFLNEMKAKQQWSPKDGLSKAEADINYEGYEEPAPAPFWFLGQNFFRTTTSVAQELADWLEDPAILSDWLVSQQERMVFNQPLEVSPFAALPDEMVMYESQKTK